jgi:sigma-E factor negative regulatory protein RseB
MTLATTQARPSLGRFAAIAAAIAGLAAASAAHAQDASALLARAAEAARTLNYSGTIVYQRGILVESSRIVHVNDGGEEQEKLVNLDGPAREVIRAKGEVRCYYPDAKLVRIEPRTFRNAFPALSPQQQGSLAQYYTVRAGEGGRVAGIDAQSWRFEPKDGLRYGHEFWTDPATGMLLKARTLNERGEAIEQFAFSDLAIGTRIDRDAARPTWAAAPANWQVRQMKMGAKESIDTGWVVLKLPPGFVKIMEGRRDLGDRPEALAQIVFSDGLVAVSVFIEQRGGAQRYVGRARQGGINQYSVKQDDYIITALGEAPADAVRMMATSVTRR